MTISGTADGGTYSTSNSADQTVWPSSGTWTFNTSGTQFIRDDGVEVTITGLTTSNLVLNFNIITAASAKAGVIEGNWEFSGTYQ